MSSWDELERKYGAAGGEQPSNDDPWASLEQKYSAPTGQGPVLPAASPAFSVDDMLPSNGVYKYLPSSLKAGIVSTGREIDKLAKGAESGWLRLTGQDEKLAELRATESGNDAAFKHLADAYPVSTTVGAIAPYIAVAPGTFASVPAAALRGVAPKAAAKVGQSMVADAALQGAAFGQLRQGDETSAASGAIGGAIGGTLGRGAQKLLSPGMGQLSAQQVAVTDAAQRLGARVTPGQALNSQALQRMEAGLESSPVTSFAMRGVREANQRATNQAAAKAIGEVSDVVDATTLANAERRIDGIYKLVKTKNKVGLDHLGQPVSDIMEEARTLTIRPGALDDDPLFSKAVDFITSGGATQEQLATLSSQLGKRAKTMMTSAQGDRELGKALFATKDALDDALEGALSGGTKKAFADARSQYRSLMQLYPAGVVNEQTGDVSAKALANTLARQDRKGFRLGSNESDMYTMGRFARAFPSIVGDSGTATRMAVPLVIGGGAAAGGAFGAASGGDPVQGAKYGLLGTALPALLARGYMTPAATKYLGNGLLSTGMPDNIIRRLAASTPMGVSPQGLLSP